MDNELIEVCEVVMDLNGEVLEKKPDESEALLGGND
jgi:hypothetical protein